jgi:hypothetical protein
MHEEQTGANGHGSKHSVEQSGGRRSPDENIRTSVRKHVQHHLQAFGRAVLGIWPVKPALHLAQIEGCSERSAEYQINGERKPSARAIHAVDGAMLEEGP